MLKANIEIDFKGIKINNKVFEQVVDKELDKTIGKITAKAKQDVPILTGNLRNNIRILKGDKTYIVYVREKEGVGPPNAANYGRYIEFGFVRTNGTYYKGKYFVTNAYLKNKDEMLKNIEKAIVKNIKDIVSVDVR